MKEKVFLAAIEHLHEMLEFIKDHCLEIGFDPKTANKIMLAAEEAIVNIIHHGYQNKKGPIEIRCEKSSHKPGAIVQIKDRGIPFNPMEKANRIKKSGPPPKDELVGGYGVFLYVEIMDQVDYRRVGDVNVLYLIKYL